MHKKTNYKTQDKVSIQYPNNQAKPIRIDKHQYNPRKIPTSKNQHSTKATISYESWRVPELSMSHMCRTPIRGPIWRVGASQVTRSWFASRIYSRLVAPLFICSPWCKKGVYLHFKLAYLTYPLAFQRYKFFAILDSLISLAHPFFIFD